MCALALGVIGPGVRARRPNARFALGGHALAQGAGDRRAASRLRRGVPGARLHPVHAGAAARADVVHRPGRRGGWRSIIAVVATFGVWAALTKWLKIQLPAGILAGILGSGTRLDGHPCRAGSGLRGRAAADQPALLLHRRLHRHAGRRAAGHRAGLGAGAASPGNAVGHARVRHHHDGRHLLRLDVRRLDHVDPGEHSGRSGVRGDVPRRPPDGQAGPRRAGAGHLRA